MINLILFFFILFVCLAIGSIVYYKNPTGYDNKLFIILVLWIVVWLLANYLENELLPEGLRIIFLTIDFVIAPILGYFWFLFCYNFLENKKIKFVKNLILFFLIIVSIIMTTSGMIIENIHIDNRNNIISFSVGFGFYFYAALIIFYFIGGSVILFFKYRRFEGVRKIQTFYVLYGFLFSSVLAVILNLFFQDKFPVSIFKIFNTLAVFIFISFAGYAIIKHHLFDVRIVIQRGVIYSVLLSIIIGFYLVLVFLLGLVYQGRSEVSILLAAGITTILGIYGVPIIEKLFRRWTDKIFFKDKYDYPQAIYKLSETLNKNIELEILLRSSVTKLKEILKVKKVLFILPEAKLVLDGTEKLEEFTEKLTPVWTEAMESGELPILDYNQIIFFLEDKNPSTHKHQALLEAKRFCQKHKLAILVPIILENKLIGLLGLGEKRSSDIFNRDDFNLLKTFSYQAAVAIEKAQLYEQVKNYSEKLEEKVKQRTAKIKGLQEEQKQMMLEIAHGLQTPLTIIKGELNFLKEVVKDKDKIKSLERTIDRTSKFIYDMLRLARLESGAQEFKKEKINLSQLLIDLTEEFKIITEERGIKIISQLEPNLYIFGNMSALEEMITNLVSNSVKYIKEDGEKKIFIYLRKQNKKAEIIIQDTGIGINKEDLSRLFERFYRTRDGRGNTKRGTGLGLAISKRIVEIHRGEIKIKSKINKGTKFIINFPLV